MNGSNGATRWIVALLAAALAACGSEGAGGRRDAVTGGSGGEATGGSGGEGAGGTAGGGGSGGEGVGGSGGENTGGSGGEGAGGTGGGAPVDPVTDEDAHGTWVLGSVRATLLGPDATFDVYGYTASLRIAAELALEVPTLENGAAYVGSGLAVHDRRTGRAHVYTAADGLPETIFPLDSFIGETFPPYTVPITSIAWLEPGRSFVAAGLEYLVVGRIDDAGGVSFSHAPVPRAGNPDDHVFMDAVTVAGGEIWAGTRLGLAVVDPTLLQVDRWVDMGVPVEEAWVHALIPTDVGGARVAALVGDQWSPLHVVLAGDGPTRVFDVGFTDQLVSLGTAPGLLLVGVDGAEGGAILALQEGSTELEEWLPAARLAGATSGNPVPSAIAFDAGRASLLVAGNTRQLLSFPFDGTTRTVGDAVELLDRRDGLRWALPAVADAIHVDPRGHRVVAGSTVSPPHRSSQLPNRWELGAGGELRAVRPFVTGVRDLVEDPGGEGLWVSVRDEDQSLLNNALGVSNLVCRLRVDGSCELYATRANSDNTAEVPVTAHVAGIGFGRDPAERAMVLPLTAGVLLRAGDTSRLLDVSSAPWINQLIHSWTVGDGALWLGTAGDWYFDADETLNSRTPRGLGLVEYDGSANPTFYRRYVRQAGLFPGEESPTEEITGLPSNHVWAHAVLPGERHLLAALGVERARPVTDHQEPSEPAPAGRGAVVEIEDATFTVYVPPKGMELGDVVALARRPDGSFLALDAAHGVLSVDLHGQVLTTWAEAPWTAPERGLSLAADGEGRVAVGTTRGLWLWNPDGTVTRLRSGGEVGFVWTVRFFADGVLHAGTDHGLLRFALDGAELPPLGPEGPLAREPWPLEPGCYGTDRCVCMGAEDCAPGLDCWCREDPCICLDHDPCLDEPGTRNCACETHDDCVAPLTCETRWGERLCSDCGGRQGCSCTDAAPCDEGLVCNAAGKCERGPCADDCSCGTATGCPDGEICDPAANPPTCVAGRPTCANDCSCPTMDGCPQGFACVSGSNGPSCTPE